MINGKSEVSCYTYGEEMSISGSHSLPISFNYWVILLLRGPPLNRWITFFVFFVSIYIFWDIILLYLSDMDLNSIYINI